MNTTLIKLASVFAVSAFAFGCGSSDDSAPTPTDTGTDTATGDTGTPPKDTGSPPGDTGTVDTATGDTGGGGDTDGGGTPAAPAIGAQIDRMGRPAINTALNNAFNPDETTKGAAKDAYNQAAPTTWATYAPEFEKNLAILDGLDTNCGNQAFADKTKTDATRYGTLAAVLANDRLWVNTGGTSCTTYLAVEATATALLPLPDDCGGRMPGYEVIKESYSLLAAGAPSGVTDGVTPVPPRAQVLTFPYLDAPH